MQNPYNNKAMLPHDSDMFFGREKEMKSIASSLLAENPQSVSVIGERRIGKSSVANRVFHKLKLDNNTIPVFLDFDALAGLCNSKDEFFQRLNEKVSECLAEKPQIQSRLGTFGFNDYPSFRGFVEKGAKNGLKFIIFIDEFEHLPEKQFADDSFFSNLRSMANNPANRLAFVTISLKSLKDLTHDSVQSSAFWNIFDVRIIGLLDDESIKELRQYGFRKNGLTVTKDEEDKIRYYAGAFPFFNQMVCKHVFDAKMNNTEPIWNSVEIELLPHIEKLWECRTKQEQKLLKSLKDDNVEENFSLKEMNARGLVKKMKDVYRPFSEHFFELIGEQFKVEWNMPTFDSVIDKSKKVIDLLKGAKGLFSGGDKKDDDEKDK